jgi:hypothetical protein
MHEFVNRGIAAENSSGALVEPDQVERRERQEHGTCEPPDPWESAMQATCECLSWRGALDNLGRRHSEDALGETTCRGFPVHARSALVTLMSWMDRGAFTADELRARVAILRERLHRT